MGKQYYFIGPGCVRYKGKKLDKKDPLPDDIPESFLMKHEALGHIEVRDYRVLKTPLKKKPVKDFVTSAKKIAEKITKPHPPSIQETAGPVQDDFDDLEDTDKEEKLDESAEE